MTNAVAAPSNAPTPTPTATRRASAAGATGTSFAQVHAAAALASDSKDETTATGSSTGSSTSAPKERTQKVAGHGYAEIVSGPRNGMFINNTGGQRDGEAFLIVKREGREFHIYGTGADRKVYEVGRKRETGAATPAAGASGTDTTAAAGTTGSTPTAGAGTSNT